MLLKSWHMLSQRVSLESVIQELGKAIRPCCRISHQCWGTLLV
jgi:hypothetical protein